MITHSEEPDLSSKGGKECPSSRTLNACPVCGGRGAFIHGGGVAASFTECPLCKGTGTVELPPDACPTCGGLGRVMRTADLPGATVSFLRESPCPTCQGSGRKLQ